MLLCKRCARLTILLLFLQQAVVQCFIINRLGAEGHVAKATTFPPSSPSPVPTIHQTQSKEVEEIEPKDTIRVRIWKALGSSEKELSLKELGTIVGERHLGDLKFHLAHVEKQAQTFGNKSKEWKERRGLLRGDTRKRKQVKIRKRRGNTGTVYIWLE